MIRFPESGFLPNQANLFPRDATFPTTDIVGGENFSNSAFSTIFDKFPIKER